MVTVAWACRSNRAIGLPTMLLRPITTACLPRGSQPIDSSIFMQPYGVQGLKPDSPSGRPTSSAPALASWNPSTSFAGSIALVTSWSSMCGGKGSCTRMPWMDGSAFHASMRASRSAWVRVDGQASSTEWSPLSWQALTLFRT